MFKDDLSAVEVDKEIRLSVVKVKNYVALLAFYLHEVKKRKLWKELGYSSEYHYASVVCGFGRQKIGYMLHFGEQLDKYKPLRKAFADGSVGWTKVREILKIITSDSEMDLVEKAKNLTNRELEALVARTRQAEKESRRSNGSKGGVLESGRSPTPGGLSRTGEGDDSSMKQQRKSEIDFAPRGTEPEPRINVTFSLTPEEHLIFSKLLKRWKQTRRETPRKEDMLRFMAGFCTEHDAFETGGIEVENSGGAGEGKLYRSPFEIVIHECPDCGKSSVGTGKGEYTVVQSLVERARCDGKEFLPEPGGAEAPGPAAAHPCPQPVRARPAPRGTVTPALRRKIFHRDRGVCRTPCCLNSMFLEIHHIKPVSHGGRNDESNMILLCSACHKHVHEKRMKIAGSHPDTEFFHLDAGGSHLLFGESRAG